VRIAQPVKKGACPAEAEPDAEASAILKPLEDGLVPVVGLRRE
jgi:hypothetical protein